MEISSVKKIWHLPDFFISIYYMKIYSYLFPFIISCFFVSGSFAATEEKSYGPEQEYTAHFGQSLAVCTSQGLGDCPSGERCGVGGSNTSCIEARCQKCSKKPGGGYDYSDSGAYNREGCFKYCVPEDVKVDGETVGQKEPSVLSVCYPSLCPENDLIYCKNESDTCNGYHAENGTCVPNRQECEEIYNGVKIGSGEKHWVNNSWLDECYVTECETGYHLSPKEEGIGDNKDWGFIYCSELEVPYGTCESDTEDACKKWLNCDGGTVGGEAKWIRADSLPEDADWVTSEWKDSLGYAGGYWDFSGCYCDKKDSVSECGVGIKQCKWESSGPWGENAEWSENCTMHGFTECKAGCCDIDNSDICNTAPAGYYGDGTIMACQPCPIGATSAVGATGIDRCFMMGDSNSPTRFCDSVGCFNLKQNIPY